MKTAQTSTKKKSAGKKAAKAEAKASATQKPEKPAKEKAPQQLSCLDAAAQVLKAKGQSLTGYHNPAMRGLLVTTHRVRRSRFLSVTQTEQGLLIQDKSGPVG